MARRHDREPGPPPRVVCAVGWQYRAIFERGATQPAPGSPTRQPRWGGAGMHRPLNGVPSAAAALGAPNGVPSAAAALGAPNAARLSPRAANNDEPAASARMAPTVRRFNTIF